MQKQTQNQLKNLQKQIDRLEKIIITSTGFVLVGLVTLVFSLLKFHM